MLCHVMTQMSMDFVVTNVITKLESHWRQMVSYMVGVVLHIFRCLDNLFYFAQYSSMHGIDGATQLAYLKSNFIDKTQFQKYPIYPCYC